MGRISNRLWRIVLVFMNKDDFIGNLSTICKILIIMVAPAVAVYLGTDNNTVEALLTAVVGLLFSLIDAKYPNSLFGDGA